MFGGWSINRNCYDAIRCILPEGSTILEFGSGAVSFELAKNYKVFSIENDKEYLNKYLNVNYIHAPIKDIKPVSFCLQHTRWYDKSVIKKKLVEIKYDLLLIDGPGPSKKGDLSQGRTPIYKYRDLINWEKPVILDDTHRALEWLITNRLSSFAVKKVLTFPNEGGKTFSVIADDAILLSLMEK